MINSFKNYLRLGKAKRKTPDMVEAKALSDKATDRLFYLTSKPINEKTAQFVFEDAYEAIREAAQALMSKDGYKPYSHEATISFIKQFYKQEFNEEELQKFDHYRQVRNNSVYKAIKITKEEAKEAQIFAKKFIRKTKSVLKDHNLCSLR